jgi:hypothetical protein
MFRILATSLEVNNSIVGSESVGIVFKEQYRDGNRERNHQGYITLSRHYFFSKIRMDCAAIVAVMAR